MTSRLGMVLIALGVGSLVSAMFFGFAGMPYGTGGQMASDCPFSASGSLCPGPFHHIASIEALANVPAASPSMLLLALALFALVLTSLFRTVPLVVPIPGVAYRSPPPATSRRKTIRWLSLFEHSPSFA